VPAHAGSFGTGSYLGAQVAPERLEASDDRAARLARIDAALAHDRVARQLEAFGVDPDDARLRVASLTDAELARLDGQVGSLEAGGSAVGIIGAVFLVLIILELVGVTNVFTGF
jgi:hypothetical protein